MSSSGQDQRPEATDSQSGAAAATDGNAGDTSEPELPPLTPDQFRVYNRLAETMDYFHDHFRKSWNLLYTAASTGKRPAGMTLKQFLDEGLSLVRYLEAHHGIEETYFFPMLARKMAAFKPASKGGGSGELLKQHQQIHAGMDVFGDYLRACRNKETELELGVMKEKMDTWGPVLLKHLDQEVKTLGAENMRRFWTPEEMRAFPI